MDREKQRFGLQPLLNAVLTAAAGEARQKGIALQIVDDLASDLIIESDPGQLRQLLQNVLQNLIRHSGAGRALVSVRQLLRSPREVLLEFVLEDDGPAKRSFRYLRSIAVVRQAVETLGGKSELVVMPGHGCLLKFLVKCPWVEAEEGASVQNACAAALLAKTILVVEDNEINQRTLTGILHGAGIRCQVANSGKEAIELLEKNPAFDLILLDLQMPHMDGLETLAYIRRRLGIGIPVIGMSSDFSRGAQDYLEAGISQLLQKPFSKEELLTRICSFFEPVCVAMENLQGQKAAV